MATSSRDVKINLAVGTTGAEAVSELSSDLRGVATAGKAAAPGVEKLAAELTALEQKTKDLLTAESAARAEASLQKAARADLVDTLARLKAETDKAGKASAEYAAKERALRLEIIDTRAALRTKQAALESAAQPRALQRLQNQTLLHRSAIRAIRISSWAPPPNQALVNRTRPTSRWPTDLLKLVGNCAPFNKLRALQSADHWWAGGLATLEKRRTLTRA